MFSVREVTPLNLCHSPGGSGPVNMEVTPLFLLSSGTHLHICSMGVIHSRSWRQDLENERNQSGTVIIRTHIGHGPTGSQASGQVKRFPALS